jgi:hypothetical protein
MECKIFAKILQQDAGLACAILMRQKIFGD